MSKRAWNKLSGRTYGKPSTRLKELPNLQEHTTPNQGRNSAIYGSNRWRLLSAKVRRGASCIRCGATAEDGRLYADHIIEIADRPDLAFVESNLQVLCASHHAAKTRAEARRRSVNGYGRQDDKATKPVIGPDDEVFC